MRKIAKENTNTTWLAGNEAIPIQQPAGQAYGTPHLEDIDLSRDLFNSGTDNPLLEQQEELLDPWSSDGDGLGNEHGYIHRDLSLSTS